MTDRRTFLTTTALAGASSLAAVSAQAPVVASAAAAPEANASGILTKAGIVSLLRKDAVERQVFATVPLKEGVVLHYLVNWLQAVQVAYGTPPAATHAVAVMYGPSLALMLDDAFWDTYVTDAIITQLGEKPQPRKGNPFLHPKPGAAPATSDDVTTLMSRGVTFLVCANAFAGAAGLFARQPNFPKDKPPFEVLRAALIPGAYLVPAGVAAVTTVQQNGYAFFQASIG
jgi:hypothetical protein